MTRLVRILSPLIVAAAAASASACAVCSVGGEDSKLAESANLSVLVMIGFVAAVLTGIASVAGFWYVRSRRIGPGAD